MRIDIRGKEEMGVEGVCVRGGVKRREEEESEIENMKRLEKDRTEERDSG